MIPFTANHSEAAMITKTTGDCQVFMPIPIES
jgi:hypothetical protein